MRALLVAALVLWAGAALADKAGADMAGADEPPVGDWAWPIPAWLPPPPVPDDNPMTAAKVELGRHLFYDARLSLDGTVACVSCHDPARAFSDGRPVAVGVGGTLGGRNAPSLGNVAYLPVLTWGNPLITRLEQHALIPIFGTAPIEMAGAGQERALFARLAADPYYTAAFAAAFPDRPAPDLFTPDLFTVTRALGAFQRTLITVNSPYDRYKRLGDTEAISPSALRGEALFFGERLECYHCHGGVNFTDNIATSRMKMVEKGFHNTGLHDPLPAGSEGIATFTLRAEDRGRFRTPSLRNVALTAPYMHDGSMATLDEVLEAYAKGGRFPGAAGKSSLLAGFTLTEGEKADVLAFLNSLTDESFSTNPALADPWPPGHPARAQRVMP